MIDPLVNSVMNDLFTPEGAQNMPHDQMVARAYGHPLPAKREWQGLTDEDCLEALKTIDPETKRLPLGFSMFAAAIQSKLKEKNT